MLTRIQKQRKAYKCFIWVVQITFVILCLTAMVSATVIGIIGKQDAWEQQQTQLQSTKGV